MRLSYDQTSKDIEMTLTIIETDGSRRPPILQQSALPQLGRDGRRISRDLDQQLLMAGLVQDVQNPGDFFVFEIAQSKF